MAAGEAMKEIFDPKEMTEEILKETKEELWWLKEEIVIWIKEFFGESKVWKFFGDKLSALAATILGVEAQAAEKDEETTKKEDNTANKNTANKIENYDETLWLIYLDLVKENQTAFANKVKEVAQNLNNTNPNRLMRIMYKESKLNPQEENSESWATGLIQFMPDNKNVSYKTINGQRYEISDIKNMSNLEQLDLLAEYYKPYKSKINSYEDLYLATLYPAALWKPDNFILWSEKSEAKAKEVGRENNMNNWKPITITHVKKRVANDLPNNYIAQFDGVPQPPTTA